MNEPADIILLTNTSNPFLAFREIEVFEDRSGYSTKLSVRSGWISAEYRFIFEQPCLARFVGDLERLDKVLVGRARLKPTWEEQFIELEGQGLGVINVSGDLIDHGPWQQRVVFAFRTDQTCLRPLIVDLRQLLN